MSAEGLAASVEKMRREGVGDAAKLLVSFPGFGQKKLVEKYAGLEKA